MNNCLALIGRSKELFSEEMQQYSEELHSIISKSSFLVLGGAGSIGEAVTKEIFKRNPKKLHVVDISENNLVELVRDIRSSLGYIRGEFKTFAIDVGSVEYDAFYMEDGKYDYVLNLSALKHVRSEKDPYSLMRMFDVNVLNTDKTLEQAINSGVKKYFCVSTDKATNPVNMMGASKLIMEMFLMQKSMKVNVSTARFANVAFSDGSLLYGFNKRIEKMQPIVAPNDVRRYFLTKQEAGELCLMSCLFGENMDIFFPKLSESLHLIGFPEIASKYLNSKGYKPYLCKSEEEARKLTQKLPNKNEWPCYFSASDTTGEKEIEEFYTGKEKLDLIRYQNMGVIKNNLESNGSDLENFKNQIAHLKRRGVWSRLDLINIVNQTIPNFAHIESGKYLDEKM